MRDPKRIKKVLKRIEEFWNKVPDWRLGQLIVNLNDNNDPYYVEEDMLLRQLDHLEKLYDKAGV